MNDLVFETVQIVDPVQFGIEPAKAEELTKGLTTILSEREELQKSYKEVISLEITKENLPIFKELRLKIRDNRTKGIEKWHKANKEFFLTGGRFVDAIKNKEAAENERMEERLMEAEKYFENIEKERIQALHSTRIELISPFVDDTFGLDLGNMADDVWEAYLAAKKQSHGERLEAARLAEEKRIAEAKAEAERLEAQRLENERLKIEAEKREAEIKAEREKQEKILTEERAKAKAEADKIAKEAEERLAVERQKQAVLEAELKAKKEAEEKLRVESERAKKEAEKLAKAPIKKQLTAWVNHFDLPQSTIDNETTKDILAKFQAFKDWSIKQVEAI